MTAIRSILVPVDFSESSRAALDYAAALASMAGAAVDILHVWRPPTFQIPGSLLPETGETAWDVARCNAEQALEGLTEALAGRGVAIRRAWAIAGIPHHAIAAFAEAGGYDLIVLGTQGRTGILRVLTRSVAESVLRRAPCPVLTVRHRQGEPPAAR